MINAERLLGRIQTLAQITDPQRPYTRRAFTELYQQGREWLRGEMLSAGLEVRLDDGANLIGRRGGLDAAAGTLMLGSHTDTVVGGGRYDGILGVLVALEAAQSLFESGQTLRHALEVVDFLSEEPSDYGASCVGSRAMAGTLTPALLAQSSPAGETLAAAMARMGANVAALTGPQRNDIAAYLELHIEQGPVLEHAGHAVGIVSGIVAIERFELTFTGQADHAGTTPMHLRRDALVAAAGCVTALSVRAVQANADAPLVATVGQLRVFPGNSNVIPGEVVLVFEARALDAGRLSAFTADFLEEAASSVGRQGVQLTSRLVSQAAPLACDGRIQTALAQSCEVLKLPYSTLVSGAGHDAMHIGRIAPAGMLFVPSVGGRSHAPDELTRDADVLAGAQVVLETVVLLDESF